FQSGASSDKHRWSFRKRSSRHRVLSNTAISEPLPVVSIKKDRPEASCDTSNSPVDPFTVEKIPSPKKINDILQQPHGTVDTKMVDASLTNEDTIKPDPGVQESAAAVIQAAIRGYLVRQEMKKLKSVVKLQATVRGHLVRRQAAGTLRCVQAVIKIQALVRARLVRQSVGNLTSEVKLDTCWADIEKSENLEKEISESRHKKSCYSSEKLLTNGFARQLLESTPKSKPIHIHSDPSRSESAWKWLERWMALSSSDVQQKDDLNLKSVCQEQRNNRKPGSFDIAEEASAVETIPSDKMISSILHSQTEDSIINSASNFEFQAPSPVVVECFSPDGQEDFQDKDDYVKDENIKETSVLTADVVVESASIVQSPDVSFDKPEEKVDHLSRRTTSDSLDAEDKKFVFGTRKVCNPAFAAAQAKFEELSSAGSLRSKSSNQDVSIGSRTESLGSRSNSLKFDSFTKASIVISEESVSHEPKVQTATSECGTEISISSTLDSPDRSEAEGGEIVLELGALEIRDSDENDSSDNAFQDPNSDTKNTSETEILESSKHEIVNENPTDVALDSVQIEQLPSLEHVAEQVSSDISDHQENVIDQEVNRLTPEGSPRSHITVPESHGTPSSQISVNTKINKDNNLHRRKQRPQVTGGKRSPSNLDVNSGGRSSTEHLPKDAKNGKRRNSFGMAISDHVEHEPRASTSNSLPNYMQATESARAKLANNSPKSSPDVHKDSYSGKRHSLPMGNEKQGSSPRMQRSSSQVQPKVKQNGIHSPHNSAVAGKREDGKDDIMWIARDYFSVVKEDPYQKLDSSVWSDYLVIIDRLFVYPHMVSGVKGN
ncbi:hypothetical protein Taro_020395, partial [Colocasia esculenta]|nr:hypothetical protein [Colocasia esculenta]